MLIVDADIEMRVVVDEAWERPRVSADTRGDAFEIEQVALLDELASAFRIDRNIYHQRPPDAVLGALEHRRAHAAPGAVGAEQHRSFEGRAIGPHAHRAIG